jgi:hypothetical protein
MISEIKKLDSLEVAGFTQEELEEMDRRYANALAGNESSWDEFMKEIGYESSNS